MSFFGKYYFASYRHSAGEPGQVVEDLLRGAERPGVETWLPPTDIYETDDGVVVRTEVAGLDPREIHVRLCGDVLTVRGRRDETCSRSKRSYRQMEMHHGPFERSLRLSGPFAANRATAAYRQGILEIFLPRDPEARPMDVVVPVEGA